MNKQIETDPWTQRAVNWWLPKEMEVGGLGERGEGSKKYRMIVTELSQKCK